MLKQFQTFFSNQKKYINFFAKKNCLYALIKASLTDF